MPELPELQAHAERLTTEFGGSTLRRVEPLSFTALKTVSPSPDAARGQPLVGVGRRGKYLLLGFGSTVHVVHLMQGGRLKPDPKRSRKPRGGVLRWVFADDRALLLTEAGTERRAGVWVLDGGVDDAPPPDAPPLDELGPEADALDAEALADRLAGRRGRLHSVLRDQRVVAGIGRRLANEVFHRAELSPFAPTARLGVDEIARLADAIAAAVVEGLAAERARPDMSSSRERPARVHHRAGQRCPVCGDTVRAVEYADYEIDYCPTCQTNGRVLADNTTSKFLK